LTYIFNYDIKETMTSVRESQSYTPPINGSDDVSRALYANSPRVWEKSPDYTEFDRASSLGRITHVYHALRSNGDVSRRELDAKYEDTIGFFNGAFDAYESKRTDDLSDVGRVFVVPMRITREREEYASEVLPFAPLLDPKFGVNADIRQKTVVGLPPCILDSYTASDESDRRGALVLAPIFGDMERDTVTHTGLRRQYQRVKLARLVARNINLTAKFSSEVLGAKVMGLGAIIPAVTKFGTTIKNPEITTTTGHGGTVDLILQTAKKSFESLGGTAQGVGVIGGAGSIGYSTLDVVRDSLPDQRVITYDKNTDRLRQLVDDREDSREISVVDGVSVLLMDADVIIAAVTTPIDLDVVDPGSELDLRGKIIIDDSQPGSFNREQVEARGGRLVWVVGNDSSEDGFLQRTHGYTYGTEAGLYGSHAVWGCEAEAAVIAASGEYDKAIQERVTPRHARQIGELCARYSVTTAPFQSYGNPVSLS
jgi:predicted amino acid dehydrogenase